MDEGEHPMTAGRAAAPAHEDSRTYPSMAADAYRTEPVPRRVRGFVGGEVAFDSTRAVYVWEWPGYPQYYLPLADVTQQLLVDEQEEEQLEAGTARRYALQVGETRREAAAWVHSGDRHPELCGLVRFEWDAVDAWFEEDEEIFVHPRNPYTRVDAIRSHRRVRVERDGVVLAETSAPVLVFETGLPTRYYIARTDVRFEHLVGSDTETSCPYKGTTTDYWSAQAGGRTHPDLAWSYDFPTPAVASIAGMVAFYNERVDLYVDEELLPRQVAPRRTP